VEQKNWSIVRQLVGYERYETASACDALQALYEVVRLYTNFFQPSLKLVAKERVGSKAKTPYQRVLESGEVTDAVKASLRQQYASLNPVALLRQMQRLQGVLWKLAAAEPPAQDRVQPASS
jgi:hypothetical protein